VLSVGQVPGPLVVTDDIFGLMLLLWFLRLPWAPSPPVQQRPSCISTCCFTADGQHNLYGQESMCGCASVPTKMHVRMLHGRCVGRLAGRVVSAAALEQSLHDLVILILFTCMTIDPRSCQSPCQVGPCCIVIPSCRCVPSHRYSWQHCSRHSAF
jgi:hypothetical protein